MKDYQKGIEDFTTAINLDSSLKEAYFGRGMAYYMISKADEACWDFKTAYSMGYEKAGELLKSLCKQNDN
jgi:tetratricopeptide (TPR) repeat protein